MDNIRPAGFGILNRNPHAAKSPAYSQIWENVCPSVVSEGMLSVTKGKPTVYAEHQARREGPEPART